jgi:F1F0 ATPase subunit 2
MSSLMILVLLSSGVALGVVFYGGLWLTVRWLATARNPVLLTLCSFWVRTLIVLASFLFLMQGRWEYAVISLLGFTMGRFAVSRYLPLQEARPKCP